MLCRQNPQHTYQLTLRKLNGKDGYTITQWDFKANLTSDGRISGVIGVGYDITDFESRQDHIKFLTSTLRDVAYKQSHLIRRPLANIIGLVEILEQDQLSSSSKDIVAMLKQSVADLNYEFDTFLIKDDDQLLAEE
jgi:signal transduction histidine kinase